MKLNTVYGTIKLKMIHEKTINVFVIMQNNTPIEYLDITLQRGLATNYSQSLKIRCILHKHFLLGLG